MFKYYIYKFAQFVVNRLPLRISYAVAVFISNLHYYLSFRDRRAVKNNLKSFVSDDEDISKLAKEVFRNFGKYLVEFFRMAQDLDHEYSQKNVTIKNREYFDKALSRGKGVITLTAHIGNWEMGAAMLSLMGQPPMCIALPHKERPVNDLFNSQRESQNITVVPTNIAIRRCLDYLRNNQIVALVGDRDFGGNGEIVDFLGRGTLIPKGPATFSLKTGAAILPVFLFREENGKFTLFFEKPIFPDSSDKDDEAVLNLIKKYIVIIEKHIRQRPSQWLMFREFWAK